MAEYFQYMYDIFWKDENWFGGGHKWSDIDPKTPEDRRPKLADVGLQSLLLGIALLFLRHFVQTYVIYPFGIYIGVKPPRKIYVQPNPELEAVYKQSKKPNDTQIAELSKKTDLSEKQINIWFRRRRRKDMSSTMKKFQDCSWHFLIHVSLFIIGMVVLWDKSWFWDSRYIFEGWPHQLTDDMYWYYLVELAVYWNFCFAIAIEHRRKDFMEMSVHHLITLILLFGSYITDFLRFGSMVLIVHDAVDYWLSAAKMAKYSKKQTICEVLFAVFVLSWILFRLIIFPTKLVYTVLFNMGPVGESPIMYALKAMLCTLQVLHVVWSVYITNAIVNKFRYGQVDDVRSEQEDGDESDNETKTAKVANFNGANNNYTVVANGTLQQNGHAG